jgi:hypothetical protein
MLSARDENAIRFIFCDAEAYAGLKSSFGQQTDRLRLAQLSPNALKTHAPADPLSLSEMPIKSSRGGVGENRSMAILEHVEQPFIHVTEGSEAHPAEILSRRHVAATFRALQELSVGAPAECRALRVLHLILGPKPPGNDLGGDLGHLWPIANYTDEVEAVRLRLVDEEHERQAAHATRAQSEIEHACRVWEPPPWPKFHGPFEEEWYERFVRPIPCNLKGHDFDRMRVSAERMVSPADALRVALDPSSGSDKQRARFALVVRLQCEALYAEAVLSFLDRRYPR